MTTKPPNFGDAPWPERDPEVPYDHERAAKEFLDAADRICSQAKVGAIPFDINVITAAQVNATIGVGEALLAMLQELRSRSKNHDWGPYTEFTFLRRRTMSDSPEPSAATRESGAAVRVPAPPLLFAAPLAATLALHKWLPLPLPGRPVTTAVGAVLTIAGLALSGSGAATFRRNRTTVVPHHPVSTLVTKGPYRISRNPMYTGLTAAYVGAALWVGTWWPLMIAPLPVLATHRWVIVPEEEYLERRFGDEYERYQSQVRRWL